MARLYADENFPLPVIQHLRNFNHDVLSAQDAGNANLGIPDPDVLAFARATNRVVLTINAATLSSYIVGNLTMQASWFA